MTTRNDGRADNQLRPFSIDRSVPSNAAGKVIVRAGNTVVLCTASVSLEVPPWMAGKGKGWVTAEYNMLPGSTSPRKSRDRNKVDGRTTEIQRLIGRSLRAVVDLKALGERQITVDCDVLQADGGTRTASITGGFIALVEAVSSIGDLGLLGDAPVFTDSLCAISAGVVDGRYLLDLNYPEDSSADVDMNLIMTGSGRLVEVQGTGEEATFSLEDLNQLAKICQSASQELTNAQRESLGVMWPY